MGSLIQAAQGLDIKKGVSRYTVTHFDIDGFDLRSSNLANNFENGDTLRTNQNRIKTTNAYVYSEDGTLEKPVIYSDFIGRLYHINDTVENSNLKFITEEGFTNFESAIRATNIRDNINDFYYNIVPMDYSSYIFGDYNSFKVPQTMMVGDEYSLNGHVLHSYHGFIRESNAGYANELEFYTRKVNELTGNDGLSSDMEYEYKGLISSNQMDTQSEADVITDHRDRNYTQTLKDILEIGNLERYRYDVNELRYNFDYFKEFAKNVSVEETLMTANYGDLTDLTTPLSLASNYGKFGLKENSDEYRSENTVSDFGYTFRKQYAIGPENEETVSLEMSFFSVDESEFLSKFTEITKGRDKSIMHTYKTGEDGQDISYREHDGPNKDVPSEKMQFIPLSETPSNFSKMVQRTNQLFNNLEIHSLINRFHTTDQYDADNELITSKSEYGLSRGRNLLVKGRQEEFSSGYGNPYCRVWTAHHQYGKLNTLIRPFKEGNNTNKSVQSMYKNTSLRPNNGGEVLSQQTVLKDNGFVRITPTHDSKDSIEDNIKRCMFSIENLAWRGYKWKLSAEQKGPENGRIMWFPPYNLKFSENINVDWNANRFIGRGEQIYTYTNTDRSGTLSFTLLIDHPSIVNKWRGTANTSTLQDKDELEDDILRFFAGCAPLEGVCGNEETIEPQEIIPDDGNINPEYEGPSKKVALVLFFPNNFSGDDLKDTEAVIEKLRSYENGTNEAIWTPDEQDDDIENQVYDNVNKSLYNLNYAPSEKVKKQIKQTLFSKDDEDLEIYSFFDSTNGYDHLNEVITDINSENGMIFGEKHKNIKIDFIEAGGNASQHANWGTAATNQKNNNNLGIRRRALIKDAVDKKCDAIQITDFKDDKNRIITLSDKKMGTPSRDINSLEAKIGRSAYVIFRITWDEDATTNDAPSESGTTTINNQNYDNVTISGITLPVFDVVSTYVDENEYSYDNEYLYFAERNNMKDEAYERIIERVRYFNPAYHSITPEGFNARLTFLQQCTRQGPTEDLSSGQVTENSSNYTKYAGNLSFGRAPYCILRIGDFFNTKICIDSISIDYDAGSGVQWDLNPEGVGVQPMFANVNINFKFIGGQDIQGPVEKLQNAVSYNYYANASIYDKRAERGNSYKIKGQTNKNVDNAEK